VKISNDRKTVSLNVADFGKGDQWVDRVYDISIQNSSGSLFGETPSWKDLKAYFTLRAIAK
jgi:hypothetical protein